MSGSSPRVGPASRTKRRGNPVMREHHLPASVAALHSLAAHPCELGAPALVPWLQGPTIQRAMRSQAEALDPPNGRKVLFEVRRADCRVTPRNIRIPVLPHK